jgi:hypothetical protein
VKGTLGREEGDDTCGPASGIERRHSDVARQIQDPQTSMQSTLDLNDPTTLPLSWDLFHHGPPVQTAVGNIREPSSIQRFWPPVDTCLSPYSLLPALLPHTTLSTPVTYFDPFVDTVISLSPPPLTSHPPTDHAPHDTAGHFPYV